MTWGDILRAQGGTVVREIRDTTGAKVKLDDSLPGVQERPIIIYSADRYDAVLTH